jgi:large subunit ribosomal protein L23
MKIKPLLTEKTLAQAKEGKYAFWVERTAKKGQIKEFIESTFSVHVKKINTLLLRKGKKAIVRLGEKEKIAAFEIKEKK